MKILRDSLNPFSIIKRDGGSGRSTYQSEGYVHLCILYKIVVCLSKSLFNIIRFIVKPCVTICVFVQKHLNNN